MSPRARRRGAWALLVVSLVAWPASQLTVAGGEPTFTLGLSWLSIVLVALDILATTHTGDD